MRVNATLFVHEEASRDLYLAYADGRHYGDAPVKMKHYSFNPGNDVDFVRELPALLDRLKESNASRRSFRRQRPDLESPPGGACRPVCAGDSLGLERLSSPTPIGCCVNWPLPPA